MKRRVSLWARLWSDGYRCEPDHEATGILEPDYEVTGICVSPINKWTGICVSPILKWTGIFASQIMNSNDRYLCEPDIISDLSVCVSLKIDILQGALIIKIADLDAT